MEGESLVLAPKFYGISPFARLSTPAVVEQSFIGISPAFTLDENNYRMIVFAGNLCRWK